MVKRKIIEIDEELCNGCGACVSSCAEGAIEIVDGKARLRSDSLCDGIGACLGECPEGALRITEREAQEFVDPAPGHSGHSHAHPHPVPGQSAALQHAQGCPSARILQFGGAAESPAGPAGQTSSPSGLGHWPVKLRLVPPHAPFLQGRDLVLVADCVAFAWADLHRSLLQGRAILIGCPKFDDPEADLARLTAILRGADVLSLTVVHMEVPCCHGYWHLAEQAVRESGKNLPLRRLVISVQGQRQTAASPEAPARPAHLKNH